MSDDLVKRYQMVGEYTEWQMVQVDGDDVDYSSETEWVKADDHTAALVAKDAENARLREALQLAVGIAEDWIHDELDGTGSLDDALAELEPARAALNAQPKGETP